MKATLTQFLRKEFKTMEQKVLKATCTSHAFLPWQLGPSGPLMWSPGAQSLGHVQSLRATSKWVHCQLLCGPRT